MPMKRKFRVWCIDTKEYDTVPLFLTKDGNIFHILPTLDPVTNKYTAPVCKSKEHQVEFLIGVYGDKEIFENDMVKGFYDDPDKAILATFQLCNAIYIPRDVKVVGNINEAPEK